MPKFASAMLLLLATACASTGSTFRSGVGDTFLEHPPYHAGHPVDSVRVVHLPVHFQPGASQSPIFDPASGIGTPVAALLEEMNALLDSLGRWAAFAKAHDVPTGTPPNVYFGCASDASGDCVERGDSVLGRRGTTMHLALQRPSPEWIARARRVIDSAGATHALLVTLEVGQYWVRQSGLRGSKSVELGTEYIASFPWLTSLETPVSVLQLTGVLVDREGRGLRIGAEGIMAQRTRMLASAIGGQRLIADGDVAAARSLRRDDLPGQPLAWRTALCHLVSGLSGHSACP